MRYITILALSFMISSSLFAGGPPSKPVPAIPTSPIVILSMDGAAARGFAQFELLSAIENRVNEELRKIQPRPPIIQLTDLFDVYAGTSAGSLNVGALLIPGNNQSPKMTLSQIKEKIPEILEDAFTTSLFRKVRVIGGMLGSKYSAKPLEDRLKEYAGTTKMSELIKPAIITSYDIRAREVMNFSTYESCQGQTDKNIMLWQAMRASSAAPTYYKPLELQIQGKMRALVDAGLFVMSPTVLSWIEAQKIYPARQYIIISISGGKMDQDRTYRATGATAGGIPSVLVPTIETALEGQQALTDKIMKEIPGIEYHRLTFNVSNKNFDDFSDKNIKALKSSARTTISSQDFKDVVASLVKAHMQRLKLHDVGAYQCKAR